jgi:hypothetical protein
MHESHVKPTPEQWEHSAIVQTEMLEVLARLNREGVDWRVCLVGATSAIAQILMENVGPAEVPVFFARQAATTMHLAKPELRKDLN